MGFCFQAFQLLIEQTILTSSRTFRIWLVSTSNHSSATAWFCDALRQGSYSSCSSDSKQFCVLLLDLLVKDGKESRATTGRLLLGWPSVLMKVFTAGLETSGSFRNGTRSFQNGTCSFQNGRTICDELPPVVLMDLCSLRSSSGGTTTFCVSHTCTPKCYLIKLQDDGIHVFRNNITCKFNIHNYYQSCW